METMGFKDRLKVVRKQQGLKQTDLADALDVAVDTVRRWEAGSHEPKLSDVVKLASAMGVTVAELIGEYPLPKAENHFAAQQQPKRKKRSEKIVFQHGLVRVEIPATTEGYAIVRDKLKEFPVDSMPQKDFVESLQTGEEYRPSCGGLMEV